MFPFSSPPSQEAAFKFPVRIVATVSSSLVSFDWESAGTVIRF